MQQGSGDASCVLNVATRCWCDSQAPALAQAQALALAQALRPAQVQAPALAQACDRPRLRLWLWLWLRISRQLRLMLGAAELRH